MTNTNDFRRYSYQSDPSYLISGFDLSRGSEAPRIKPKEETKHRLTVHENASVKSRAELNAEQKRAHKQAVMVVSVAVLCLVLIASVICSLAVKNEYTRKLASQQIAISNAQSEYISLQSQLDAMVSISMIDEYAVNELGMTKMKSNQIQYMDVDEFKTNRQAEMQKQAAQTQSKSSNK